MVWTTKLPKSTPLPTGADAHLILVGAGMVGASLALALAPTGMHIKVLERAPQAPEVDLKRWGARVSALNAHAYDVLAQLGIWDTLPRVTPYQKMHVWDAEGTGELEFNAADLQLKSLGYIVENHLVVAALQAKLQDAPNIDLHYGCEPVAMTEPDTQGLRTLVLETASGQQTLKAPLIVAADGAHSPLRQWAHMKTREWDYGHTALVTRVGLQYPHQETAWQAFLAQGPLAFLPLTDLDGHQHQASIVWSTESQHAQRLSALQPQDFARELQKAFGNHLGQIQVLDPVHSFPLRQRHATTYVKPGFALVGDAAHTIHPLAGQGVNLGFKDVHALANLLIEAYEREIHLGDVRILQRYSRSRQPDNLSMMASMEALKRLFGARPLPICWIRNWGMRRLNQQAWIKNALISHALGEHLPLEHPWRA